MRTTVGEICDVVGEGTLSTAQAEFWNGRILDDGLWSVVYGLWSKSGFALGWDKLDVHFSIAGLMAGRFGNKKWMEELKRREKRAVFGAKATTTRATGKKSRHLRRVTRRCFKLITSMTSSGGIREERDLGED